MKSRLTILMMAALFLGACSSGSYVTGYDNDDIYFNPANVPPPIDAENVTADTESRQKSANRMVISDIQENEEGSKTMNNYIFDATEQDADALVYSMDQYDLESSDTSVYYNDEDVKYVINNYYDGESVDYAYRIRRFHRPHFYDPFYWDSWYYGAYLYDPFYYSSWYSPSWSFGWRMGHSWHSPYNSWGWGYSPWHSPYYAGYYGGYYGGWNGGYYGGNPWYGHGSARYIDSEDYRYGQRRSTGSGVVYGDNYQRRSTTSGVRSSSTTTKSAREGVSADRRGNSVSGARVSGNTVQTPQRAATNSNVVTERRRVDAVTGNVRSTDRQTGSQSYTRPGNTTTRSYTRPTTGVSTTPRVVAPQNRSNNIRYTAPGSTSNYNRTYRSSSTYNRSSGTTTNTRSYRAPSGGTDRSYMKSTPSRSNTPSYNRSYSSPSRSSSPVRSGSSGSSGSSGRSSSSSSGRR